MLPTPLSTNLQDPSLLYFHLHFFLLQPWKISLEYVCFWVSFQLMRALTKAKVSQAKLGTELRVVLKGKPSKGSQISRENGSKMLLHCSPKMLGMSNILLWCCCL
uniref:Uncharacterized protein n=1 Tax=Nelumbo nucifera TaxID=4432 RepID=A0A822YIV4_NELNU|nr:TPA_asm: hypothetical protein HUJ06_010070 [Nelumbo nucifera]